jgi:hypothetical protein
VVVARKKPDVLSSYVIDVANAALTMIGHHPGGKGVEIIAFN